MKTSIIRSTWLAKGGYRLDCSPYLGGALEAQVLLEELAVRKDPLGAVTVEIFNGPQFVRNYLDNPDLGVPFMTGSSMKLSDLSRLPLLSKKDAHSQKLRHLEIKPGMTLISCLGTIGQMAYARPEMAGVWASQDVLKVVPNTTKIPSGFLYTYLSSKFGIPLITSGTYGGIIQHLEPEHISGLPVPRFGAALEKKIHDLVEEAGVLRSDASRFKREAIELFESSCSIPLARPLYKYTSPLLGKANPQMLASRMDSTYYIEPCVAARNAFDRVRNQKSLGEVASVFIPGIFKRQYSNDPDFGYPYITGADVFCIKPASDQNLLKSIAEGYRLLLKEGMIVLHEAGQRYGLIGRGVMVGKTLDGFACTNNMVRVMPLDPDEAGFIFIVLSSEHGIRLLKREAAGSSIPHLDESRVRNLRIPWPSNDIRKQISVLAHKARSFWDSADMKEDQATSILTKAITGKPIK